MAGQVAERTKKARAADLLALGADGEGAGSRARAVGTATRVLPEQRLDDGRWVGHAEDHVLVAVRRARGDPADLENAILTVRRTAVDDDAPERVSGEPLHLDPAPRTLRRALPVLSGSPEPSHA